MTIVTHSPLALRHYREQISLSVALLAKKTGINENKLIKAEDNPNILTFKQLKKIADCLFVPVFFLLSETLHLSDLPSDIDYRNHNHDNDPNTEYLLKKTIYEVIKNRNDLLYTYDSIDITPKTFDLQLTGDNAEEDAKRIRSFLQIDTKKLKTHNDDDYYQSWRLILERQDVLVLEINRTDIHSEGFALYYRTLPIITILSKNQSPSRRLFTMVHELVHLGLRQSAIDGNILTDNQAIERYCNQVAGFVLLPMTAINQTFNPKSNLIDNIATIRKKQKISRQAIAIQLKLTGKISQDELDDYLTDQNKKHEEKQENGRPMVKTEYTAYSHFGKVYIQQVLSATMDNSISMTSAMNILGIKTVEHYRYLEQRAFS
ncbi:MAG: XRE family transcriptional regulator [Moraxella sp.]|nr:XRE family transcriptional regulator [Moraxella sp.]